MSFLQSSPIHVPKPPQKTQVLITGASRGIGRVTALELAKRGYNLALVVRDRARGEKVVKEARRSGAESAIELIVGDLSRMGDVVRIANEFLGAHDSLDILINNAGAIFQTRGLTVDGFEQTFATNHLSYFLLTRLLEPALEKAAPSRVVVVASNAHRWSTIKWDDLTYEKSYSAFGAYAASKLANVLFTRELARRLETKGVTVNSVHPGYVATNFGRDNSLFASVFARMGQVFAISEEKGAKTSLFLATHESVAGVTGKYFSKCREEAPNKHGQSEVDAARLWRLTEQLLAPWLGTSRDAGGGGECVRVLDARAL